MSFLVVELRSTGGIHIQQIWIPVKINVEIIFEFDSLSSHKSVSVQIIFAF